MKLETEHYTWCSCTLLYIFFCVSLSPCMDITNILQPGWGYINILQSGWVWFILQSYIRTIHVHRYWYHSTDMLGRPYNIPANDKCKSIFKTLAFTFYLSQNQTPHLMIYILWAWIYSTFFKAFTVNSASLLFWTVLWHLFFSVWHCSAS